MKKKSVDRRHPGPSIAGPPTDIHIIQLAPLLENVTQIYILFLSKNTKIQNTTDIRILQLAPLLENVTQIYNLFLSKIQRYKVQ